MTSSAQASRSDSAPDTGHDVDIPAGEVTAQGAAARLGVHARTVRRAIARGELPAVKRHGAFHIALADLAAWHARRTAGPSATPAGTGLCPGPALPRPVTALVGREREVEIAIRMLRRDDVRLLTLTGAGGIGKTRLSLEVAMRLKADYASGVYFVPLAEVPHADLVAARIAESLGLPDPDDGEGSDALARALREANALLVLDNLEHVMEAAPLIAHLLHTCPSLKVMATSRSLLRVRGEHALPVPPLELPGPEDASVAQAATSPAVRLFLDRAQAVAPSFALTESTVPVVAAICQRLAGLPLAIELAASQVTVLPPDVLLARIEARLPLPVGGPRDAPDRQRTMTNAIAWSYTLLSPEMQRLFRKLGVFAGGFAIDAAEAVNAPAPDTLAALAALVDASLVQRDGEDTGRFAMLEPIRAFALEQLAAEGELDATCEALAGWCLDLLERSVMATTVPGGERYLERLDAEHASIRRVLEWLHQRGDADRLLRLAVAMGGYWYERNHYHEARVWTARALDLPPGEARNAATMRARAKVQLGQFVSILGDRARARSLVAEGVALLRRGASTEALALALIWQGAIATLSGAYDEAEAVFDEVLELAATIPDASIAAPLSARAMSNRGVAAHGRGNLDSAARWHRMALRICREHGYLLGTIHALCDLADVARDRGDYVQALVSYRECLSVLGERSDLRVVIDALEGAALATASWGQAERAARLLGAAAGLGETFGIPTLISTDHTAHERAMRAARAMLGEGRFDDLFAAGRRLGVADAIAEVLAVSPPTGAGTLLPASGGPLSRREREVLRLLAAGRRDREIAEALFISVRTVEGHVTRILAKLNVPTRVAAARAAVDLGLATLDPPSGRP